MHIIKIPLGITNTFLLKGDAGYILVDAGTRGHEKDFLRHLARRGISPLDIRLIVLTHTHFDHVGSLAAIKSASRCPVVVSESEALILGQGVVTIPPGTNGLGRTLSLVGKACRSLYRFDPVSCEITLGDECFDLIPYGINGKVVPTPGHTRGSLSVLLESGDAIVGDLAMNFRNKGDIYPIFAELPHEVCSSWTRVLDAGAKCIHVAHGPSFPRRRMEEYLARRAGR